MVRLPLLGSVGVVFIEPIERSDGTVVAEARWRIVRVPPKAYAAGAAHGIAAAFEGVGYFGSGVVVGLLANARHRESA